MCFGGGSDPGKAARQAEAARQAQIAQGASRINQTFDSRFNDDFYGGIKQSALDYYNPQLERQIEDARRNLTLSLARSGNLQSSEMARRKALFDEEIGQAELDVANRARGYADDSRNRVASARSNLLRQNSAMGGGGGQLALAQADALANTPTFDPLGAMFQNVTAGLATQADLERRNRARFNTGLFGGSDSGSGRTVG